MKHVFHLSTALTFISAILGTLFGSPAWAASGIGGSGGGPRMEVASMNPQPGQVVTVEVCDGGESGVECRTVTYRVRPQSKPEPVKCMVSHGEAHEVPCPKNYGVPKWIKRLNESFGAGRASTSTTVDPTDFIGGQ